MSEWELVTADEAFSIVMGRQRSPSRASGPHMTPYLRSANVGNGKLDLRDVKLMDFSPDEQQRFRLMAGDVLVSEGSASERAVGMPAAWNNEIAGNVCFQNTLLRYRAIPGVSEPGFVYQWCRWAFESGVFLRAASGTNIKHIGSSRAARMTLRIPPPEEQQRIVSLMSTVDAQVGALTEEASRLRSLLVTWRANAYRRYQSEGSSVRLGDVLEQIKRPVEVDPNTSYLQIGVRSHGRGVFTKEAVTGEELGSKKVFWTRPGDFVINIVFAWEGAVGVVPDRLDGYCASHRFPTYRRKDDGDIEFFRHFFSTSDGITVLGECSPGGAGRNRTLNRGRLLETSVFLPDLREQESVVLELGGLESLLLGFREELAYLHSFRTALLNALLNQEVEIPESYGRLVEEVS